jgi:hypothetical protein
MRGGILVRRHDRKSVAIPRDHRRRLALGLAVERGWFVLCNELVFGMFDDARVGTLIDQT